MNADQKKRIAHEISNWKNACNCRAVQLTGDRMAALLQEVVDAPEHAGVQEPVAYQVKNGWASVAIYQRQLDAENYAKDQQKRHDLSGSLAHFYVVPLYTAPPAPSVPDVLAATNPSQISSSADLPTWENGDDPLVGGGLISRGVVDFASLGIWSGKPAPDVEPVAYVTGYNNGYPTIAPIETALCMAIGTALYSAPPAPSARFWESSMNNRDCTHGQLARSCNICELEQEVAMLRHGDEELVPDQSEQNLEMVRQELFQAQQALLNEGQQRDKLLAALTEIVELDILKYHHAYAIAKGAIEEVEGQS